MTPAGSPARPATILLVRHTDVHNPRQVLYGRLPRFRLSEEGWSEATRVAERLSRRPVAAVYSSPLLRARQTAQAIVAHHPGARLRQTSLLHEVGSAWQGRTFGSFPPGFSTFDNPIHPGDESMEDILERMLRFVRRCARWHPGQTVVGVSHGDPITILRVALLGKPLTLPTIRGADYAALGSVTEVQATRDGEMEMAPLG